MDLSPEDALRVNVLLAGNLKAVRIDESRMTLHALSDKGEASIQLTPNCRDESYLRRVRETLSSHVLGSPGGYPVYLKRWTRMGQARDGILESLLLLGEPEAVVAVVNATGITDELARRAWWAVQTSDNARCMLQQEAVVKGRMGPVLAEFLVEFLPFEEEPRNQIRSVRLVLQESLVNDAERERLWEKGRHRNALQVGFLQAVPDDLPDALPPHPDNELAQEALEGLCASDNPFARQYLRLLGSAGQTFLATVERIMKKPSNQDVMVELMHAIAAYNRSLPLPEGVISDIDAITPSVEALLNGAEARNAAAGQALAALQEALPQARQKIHAMLVLAMLDEPVLNPVFSKTDAIGTVMRKKLKPVTEPIHAQISILSKH
ncbi:MAG: sulfur reduction protein DsrS [Gammaproteobacteria bacterium]|nr:sulfur reduction protein DsrS [Gammaproteobacteria bacterium]